MATTHTINTFSKQELIKAKDQKNAKGVIQASTIAVVVLRKKLSVFHTVLLLYFVGMKSILRGWLAGIIKQDVRMLCTTASFTTRGLLINYDCM